MPTPSLSSLTSGSRPIGVAGPVCQDYARASRLEWLETNATGAFAMGSVAGANTRRYHGLLVAAVRPPTERVVTLSRLEETVVEPGGETPLSTNQYPGTLYPSGFRLLQSFRLDPCPRWTFQVGNTRLERRFFLVRGRQMVVVLYRSDRAVRLRVEPLLAFRDFHSLTHRNSALNPAAQEETAGAVRRLTLRHYASLPPLFLHHSGEAFQAGPSWHDNLEYLEELDRGLDFREDLFLPGSFLLDVRPQRPAWVVATLDGAARLDDEGVVQLEASMVDERRQPGPPEVGRLAAAADQFLVRRSDGSPTIIAGYPWFTDWGRDTMIALPGLLLARGKLAEARAVLEGFLRYLDGGLVPNRFPDHQGPAEYNTVDATLWMFQAVRAYLLAGSDSGFLPQVFYPAALSILEAHLRGTHYGIHVDADDGLLVAGGPGTNLTWMDARVNGQPVTPRHGKPVEVEALWYNALRLLEGWASDLGDGSTAAKCRELANRAAASFEARFWNPAKECLFDVLLPSGPDDRVRPNQLLALSLPFPLLQPEQRRAVLRQVESQLLTPVGVRTLARGEPGYQPHYAGGPAQRDAAYHQGLVWPWLLGPFVDGYLAVHGDTPHTRQHCRGLLQGLELLLLEQGCLGSVSECFEPEAPFRPVGAPAQAWSVAELLRVQVRVQPEQAR
ncbi:MAG: amylo-alpha-1,6-glucosidase [Myxococcaceae bacterium]